MSVVDGQPYQDIDLWTGDRNEQHAGLVLAPLSYATVPAPAAGALWIPPVSLTC